MRQDARKRELLRGLFLAGLGTFLWWDNLQISLVSGTFSLVQLVIGPLLIVTGGAVFIRELQRRAALEAVQSLRMISWPWVLGMIIGWAGLMTLQYRQVSH